MCQILGQSNGIPFDSNKKNLQYFKGTQNLGLWYPKDTSFNLVGYSDADYAGCGVDMKLSISWSKASIMV